MAGPNITPRGYHVDPTGKDYTLDPAPLLRAQERNFASQRETMNAVADVGRKGIQFAEYLGARTQLGRVKAQLSDLDPNDPAFAQRISSIIADNPLALENPSTAPALKMALAPLVDAAKTARAHQFRLEELTASAGGREALQAARTQGQMDVWQYKQNNAPLTDADRLGLNGGAAPPFSPDSQPSLPEASAITDSPATNIPVPGFAYGAFSVPKAGEAPGADGPNDQNLPTRAASGGPALLPDITESGDLGAAQAEAVAIHQAANEAAGDPLPPGVKRGNDGALYERKSVGRSSTWVPYKVAPEKPTTALPEGKVWVPELHEGTNDVKGWKAMAAPKLSSESQASLKAHAERIGKTDPEFQALDRAVAEAKGAFNKAKIDFAGYDKTDPDSPDNVQMRDSISRLAQTLAVLEKQRDQKAQQIASKALEVLDPKFAANKRKYEAAANGEDSILATPAPLPVIVPTAPTAPAAKGLFKSGLDAFKK